MSNDTLAAAAEIMGVPAELVQRSAQARAVVGGIGLDEVLGAWSGGAAIGTAAATSPAAPSPEPETLPDPVPTPEDIPAAVPKADPAPPPATETVAPVAAEAPEGSPILTGRRESPLALLAGAIGLFLVAVLLALVLPALDATPETPPPSGLSELGLQGREIYVAEGCWYCHTQQVRPIVTDANLGPVTRADRLASLAPDTLGIQRLGPDLARAGSREPTNDAAWLTLFLSDPRSVNEDSLQPGYDHLSDADLTALIQYLMESR